jgi:hypothetical protein
MTVYGELLFHLEAASAWAEQGDLRRIQDDIDAIIRKIRKRDNPGDDSGWTPPVPQGHSGAAVN